MSKTGNFYVYGRTSVIEVVTNEAKTVNKVFVKNSIPPNSYSNLITSAKDNLIPLVTVPVKKLERIVGRVNHQGFVAQITSLEFLDFYTWIEGINLTSNPGVLLLDGIEDPHNFGAILRTAAAAGMAAVIVPSQHQAPLNATVFKTSAGTAGRIPIIRVQNSVQGFKDLKLAGFKAFALSSDAETTIWEIQVNEPTAYVIGNEGKGISNKLMKMVDSTLMLPMENNVESLNASVTAALICYEWKRKNYS